MLKKLIPLLLLASVASAQTYYNKTTIPPSILTGTTNFQGSGSPGLTVNKVGGTGLNFNRATTGTTDTGDLFCHRTANYVGGDNTKVNACLYSKTTTTAGANAYEWNAIFFLDNFNTAANASQNVSAYFKSVKNSTGATWATTEELDDALADPITGSVTKELDLWANGTDANANRLILHVEAGPGPYAGTPNVAQGLRLSANNGLNGSSANAIIDDCWVCMTGDYKYAIHASGGSTTPGSALILDDRTTANIVYGLNLGAPYTGGFLFARNDKSLIWSTDQTVTTKYGSVDACWQVNKSSTKNLYVCDGGQVGIGNVNPSTNNTAPAYYVGTSANTNSMASPYTLYRWGVPVMLPSSGTFTTTPSAAGGLTLTTALPNAAACSATVGCYMYFPLGAICTTCNAGGNSAAGTYYTQCASTTSCSVFNNLLASGVPVKINSPTSFGTITTTGAYTQTTAGYVALLTLSVPAGSMGANGSFDIDTKGSRASSANTINEQYTFGGTAFGLITVASIQWYGFHRTVENLGIINSQVVVSNAGNIPTDQVNVNSAPTFIAVDSSIAKNIVLNAQLVTTATEWLIIYGGSVVVNYGP